MTVYFWRIYLNSFFCVFPMVLALFSSIVFGCDFGALFHSRDSFWSHFWLMFGSFFGYFGSFFVLGRTLAALGANFFITKTVWNTKGAPVGFPQNSFIFVEPFLRVFVSFSMF